MATIYFDGSSSPHRKDGAGWAIVALVDGKVRDVRSGPLPPATTNNNAELRAALEAIQYAYMADLHDARIVGDSKVVLGWLTGHYRVRNKATRRTVEVAEAYLREMNIKFDHVSSADNCADRFAKEAKEGA